MDAELIKTLLQLGSTGLVLVILLQLWAEFRVQNEFIRKMLLDAAQDRADVKAALNVERPQSSRAAAADSDKRF